MPDKTHPLITALRLKRKEVIYTVNRHQDKINKSTVIGYNTALSDLESRLKPMAEINTDLYVFIWERVSPHLGAGDCYKLSKEVLNNLGEILVKGER